METPVGRAKTKYRKWRKRKDDWRW